MFAGIKTFFSKVEQKISSSAEGIKLPALFEEGFFNASEDPLSKDDTFVTINAGILLANLIEQNQQQVKENNDSLIQSADEADRELRAALKICNNESLKLNEALKVFSSSLPDLITEMTDLHTTLDEVCTRIQGLEEDLSKKEEENQMKIHLQWKRNQDFQTASYREQLMQNYEMVENELELQKRRYERSMKTREQAYQESLVPSSSPVLSKASELDHSVQSDTTEQGHIQEQPAGNDQNTSDVGNESTAIENQTPGDLQTQQQDNQTAEKEKEENEDTKYQEPTTNNIEKETEQGESEAENKGEEKQPTKEEDGKDEGDKEKEEEKEKQKESKHEECKEENKDTKEQQQQVSVAGGLKATTKPSPKPKPPPKSTNSSKPKPKPTKKSNNKANKATPKSKQRSRKSKSPRRTKKPS